MTFDASALIGTFDIVISPRGTGKKEHDKKVKRAHVNMVDGVRFKCSRCTVKTDNEDVIISHIISANECKAGYYTDKELSRKCCSDAPTTLACIDCPAMGKN